MKVDVAPQQVDEPPLFPGMNVWAMVGLVAGGVVAMDIFISLLVFRSCNPYLPGINIPPPRPNLLAARSFGAGFGRLPYF